MSVVHYKHSKPGAVKMPYNRQMHSSGHYYEEMPSSSGVRTTRPILLAPKMYTSNSHQQNCCYHQHDHSPAYKSGSLGKRPAVMNLTAINRVHPVYSGILKKVPAFSEYNTASNTDSNQLSLTPSMHLQHKTIISNRKRELAQSHFVDMMYKKLFSLENECPILENYLQYHKHIKPNMRAVVMNWLCGIHFSFGLAQETLQMAYAIIDRYLQMTHDTKPSKLQLLAITALFISVKYEEAMPPSITKFLNLQNYNFSVKAILEMEMKIFKVLNYNLARPVPIHFLRRYSRIVISTEREHTMAKYLQELAIANYDLVSHKPSEIAAAALFLAFHFCNREPDDNCGFIDSYWPLVLQKCSQYSPAHLRPLARKIATIASQQRESDLKATYNKYLTDKYHKVSESGGLYGALATSIINNSKTGILVKVD